MNSFGIAFGGGGGRGAAHIGVLLELRRLGLKPDLVAGTSIGGLVAALVASGMAEEQMLEVLKQIDFQRVYALPGRKPALVNNRRLESLLEENIGRPTFDQLSIPLALVAVDLVERKEVIMDEGDVVSAVLATTAFPILLPPVERDGRVLIDGGILNNTPFDVVRARGGDFVLGIDLGNSAPYGTPIKRPKHISFYNWLLNWTNRQPVYQVAATMADILTSQNVGAREAISPPDLLLKPEVGTIGLFEFYRVEEGLAAGRQALREVEDKLPPLVQSEE